MRLPFLAALLMAWSADAIAAMAPPRSVAEIVDESRIVAVVRIKTLRKSGEFELATANVIQALKGTKQGATLTIRSRATLAETASYKAGEECLVFLRPDGNHYDTSRGMFGKYSVRDQKVFRWIVGRRRPVDAPLMSVLSEIRRATSEGDHPRP
jgi:hypothetical protein